MFHDQIVKVWTVCTQVGRSSQAAGRERRSSRRFAPHLGQSLLESRLAPSTISVTPVDNPVPPFVKIPPDEL